MELPVSEMVEVGPGPSEEAVRPDADRLGRSLAAAGAGWAGLERRVARLDAAEAEADRYRALLDRYELAVERAGRAGAGEAPLARVRLGWLLAERAGAPREAAYQLAGALLDEPSGAHAAWAHLGLAELALERADAWDAREHCDQVLAEGGALAPYARYRRAWASFGLSELDAAAADLVAVAREEVAGPSLRALAVHDLVRTVAGWEAPRAAERISAACGGEDGCVEEATAGWIEARSRLGLAVTGAVSAVSKER